MEKKYFLLWALSLLFTITSYSQTPIITNVVDACGNNGKFVEIYASGTVDFSEYKLVRRSNAGTWADNGVDIDLSSMGVRTDEFIYLIRDLATLNLEFPSASITASNSVESTDISHNGDDSYRIVQIAGDVVIDQFGGDTDGSPSDGPLEPWFYEDSWGARNNGEGPNPVFTFEEWTFNPANTLDNAGLCNALTVLEDTVGTVGSYEATSSTGPTTSAPVPTIDEADVVSLYSDAYTNVAVANYDPNWGQPGHTLVNTTFDPTGSGTDFVLAYPNFTYQGTDIGSNLDLSGMDFLHVDIWVAEGTDRMVKVSPINNGTGAGEFLIEVPVTPGSWNSVALAKEEFTGMTWDSVFQLKFDGQFNADGTANTTPYDIYVDNIYFSQGPASTPGCLVDEYGQFPGATFTPNPALADGVTSQTITASGWAGEYSQVTVLGGETYKFSGSVATDYYTISNQAADVVYAFGFDEVTWVADADQVIRFWTHTGEDCGFEDTNRARTVVVGTPSAVPTTNAPDPDEEEANVVSLYSDAYTNVAVANYDPNWGQSGHTLVNTTFDPTGEGTNFALAYPNFNYQGTDIGSNLDLSDMDFLHVDIWVAGGTDRMVKVSPINNGTGVGEFLVEVPVTPGFWNSVVLSKDDFVGMTWDSVFQLKFDGQFNADGTANTTPFDIYLDNIYFSSIPEGGTGEDCLTAFEVDAIPFTDTGDTADTGDNYESADRPAIDNVQFGNGTGSGSYLNGNDTVYEFTPTSDGIYNFELSNHATWVGLWLFEGCTPFTSTVAYQTGSSGTGRLLPEINLTAGTTYYVVISTFPAPQTTTYTLEITQVTCSAASDLEADLVTSDSASFTWTASSTETGGYNYAVLPAGLNPVDNADAIVASGSTATAETTVTVSGLDANTSYDFYVQAICDGTDTSDYIFVNILTECDAAELDYEEDFTGFTGNLNTTVDCWSEGTGFFDVVSNGGWTNQNFNDDATNPFGTSLYVNLFGTNTFWAASQSIDLGAGDPNAILSYDVYVRPWTINATTPLPVTDMGNHFVQVVISTDGGATWDAAANTLVTYDNSNIPNDLENTQETISLGAYSGVVKIGFYVSEETLIPDLRFYIDNFFVGIQPGCLVDEYGQWPSTTFTPNPALADGLTVQNIVTNGWAGEYSRVNVLEGETYRFSGSVDTDFYTISNDAGDVILASGLDEVLWVSDADQVIRFWTHTDEDCGFEQVNRTRSVVVGTPPECLPIDDVTIANISLDSADLSWTGPDNAVEYTWFVFAAGADPLVDTPVATGTTSDLTVTVSGLETGTAYDVYLQTDCGDDGEANLSAAFTFSTLPDYCAGDLFYDTGGPNGEYQNNENVTTTIFPSNDGDVVTVTFTSFNTELNWDGLQIYDGPDTSSPLFDSGYVPPSFSPLAAGTWTGAPADASSANGQTFVSTHPSGALTFVFTSDASATRAGWEATVTCAPAPDPEFANVQVIHNSPDPAAASVDVYLNGALLPELTGVNFREASAFLPAPANVDITVDIVPAGADLSASVFTQTFNLAADENYIVVANGVLDPTEFVTDNGFELSVYAGAQLVASDAAEVDVLVHHGSPDAPAVDVNEATAGNLVSNIAYPEFDGYLSLPVDDYVLEIAPAGSPDALVSYLAPLSSLGGFEGAAITVIASGFLGEDAGDDNFFGLWVATAAGGPLVELPLVEPDPVFTNVQVIHNSPDPAAALVDVYLDGVPSLLMGVPFRTASPFVLAPANVDFTIDVVPAGADLSESVFTQTLNLEEDVNYIIVANGVLDPSEFGTDNAFELSIYAGARTEAEDPTEVDVLVHHGSPDAPAVDVNESVAGNLVTNISYPEFDGYLSLAVADYTLEIAPTGVADPVAVYSAPLATLGGFEGAAITIVASGFFGDDAGEDNGFGLWVATAAGGPLVELPLVTTSTVDFEAGNFTYYPNPVQHSIQLEASKNVEQVEVFNVLGQRVLSQRPNTTHPSLNMQAVEAGVYIMQVRIDGTTKSFQLIKE